MIICVILQRGPAIGPADRAVKALALVAHRHEEVQGHQEAGGEGHKDGHGLLPVAEDPQDTDDER